MLILFASLSKFYPVVLTSIFLYEKKIKIIVLNFVLFLIIFFLLLLFQIGDLEKIAESIQPLTASLKGTYNFSFKALIFFFNKF